MPVIHEQQFRINELLFDGVGNITFHTGSNATERARIHGNGNISIGSTVAENILTIKNDVSNAILIKSADTNASTLQFGVDTTNGYSFIQSNILGTGTVQPLTFWVGSSERLRITTSGYIGIANNNPSELLHIGTDTTGSSDRKAIRIGNGGYGSPGGYNVNSNGDKIIFYCTTPTGYDARIGVGNSNNLWIKSCSSSSGGSFQIFTGPTPTEKLRIDNDGKLYYWGLSANTGGADMRISLPTGEIFYDTSALKYKENIREADNTDRIYKLNVVKFDRKDGSKKNEIGLIADEVKEVIPEIIAYNDKGEIESYNKSDLVPFLIAEIQKLKKELEEIKRGL